MPQYIRFVPNILSTVRLILACMFPFVPEHLWMWLIIGSGGSDVLDGWVARHWQVQSRSGAILDAVADKLFILIALLTVAGAGKFSLWWLPLLLARDLLVAFTAAYAASIKSWESFNEMDVRWSGKLATAGQFLLLLVAVLFPAGIWFALWLAILFSVVAAADYGRLFILELRRRAEGKMH
ncbi:MAG: CDP-alcohol phosphatidyltransferase family protein [Deltaproteobacteria bacterium]|nr:CDP-alcohol phosphatidyltransferase family protein [Deltaproteobacteria bacterium]